MITTHNGIFFDNIVEENSYMFIQNEKNTMNEEIEVTDLINMEIQFMMKTII